LDFSGPLLDRQGQGREGREETKGKQDESPPYREFPWILHCLTSTGGTG